MEELAIRQLWDNYDKKLEQSIQLNRKIIRQMLLQKIEHRINAFKRSHITTIVIGILWVALLVFLLANSRSNTYFLISVGFIGLFNVYAVAIYLRHLVMVNQVDLTCSVKETQRKISALQISFINEGRVLFLQAPFYCTFWYNDDLVANGSTPFWIINLSVVAFFTVISIYLFTTATYKNIHRPWVRTILESFGGKAFASTIKLLEEMEENEN
ncbi:hypothetical protein [Pedobacter metabolipauper]|uniref:Uncharacterized protein n=1 Tax=Pedobacter metabolipauper TaxID=425513 RepID=A0A4R6SWM5_9SPHI|nr:hypothetical protein [Pedobacter metabolipauper]TDQ08801.1 hypothetical protein ATK78_3319 [Pedobacter metabolipauper]